MMSPIEVTRIMDGILPILKWCGRIAEIWIVLNVGYFFSAKKAIPLTRTARRIIVSVLGCLAALGVVLATLGMVVRFFDAVGWGLLVTIVSVIGILLVVKAAKKPETKKPSGNNGNGSNGKPKGTPKGTPDGEPTGTPTSASTGTPSDTPASTPADEPKKSDTRKPKGKATGTVTGTFDVILD